MPSVITGLSKAREAQTQARLKTIIAARFERSYQAEIARAMREMGRNPKSLAMPAQKHRENLGRIIHRNYTACNLFGDRILRAVNKSVHNFDVKEEIPTTQIFTQAMQDFILSVGATRVTEIAGTTEEQAKKIINDTVTQGVIDGIGEQAIARNIQREINERAGVMSAFRSRVIARTETSTAASVATHEAGKATGLAMKKEWATSIDSRERDTHKRANGQRVGMNDKFTVGKSQLLHPSDPRGRPEEVINCRCVELLMVDW